MKHSLLSTLFLLLLAGSLVAAERLSLSGEWGFAPDFQRRGEASGWHSPTEEPAKNPSGGWDTIKGWDVVTVPHTYSGGDPRHEHTGAAWYVRNFEVPASWTGSHLRLRFASVGDRCRVWLNGVFLGAHDGVNLPFSFDVTAHARRGARNVLVLEVDNSFSDETIPGSRPGKGPNSQLVPWWNYGGIFAEVSLESEPAARIESLRTRMNFLADGSVALAFHSKLENRGAAVARVLRASVTPPVSGAAPVVVERDVALPPNASAEAVVELRIPAAQVRRWGLDAPVLYPAEVSLHGEDGTVHAVQRRLGLREIVVRGAQLLLNGEPVRLGGVNRSRGHPDHGGLDPRSLAELDLSMMKRAHLEFARLQHYPLAETLLDWADEHGMLIIAESGNWQFTDEQLASPKLREVWQRQMRSMMESSWDRPSIIGWSVGNEYTSWSDAGVAWTRDMAAWVRAIDDTRPTTFAALGREMSPMDVPREQRSPHYVDIISINIYSNPRAVGGLDRLHKLWPDKPIMISEFGQRADQVANEDVRIKHFLGTLEEVRKRPFICGLSFWTFNDYLSRYPNTTPGGYRAWGLVTGHREPRALYMAAAEELTSVVLAVTPAADGTSTLSVGSRADFPARTLRGYTVRITRPGASAPETLPLPELAPGATWTHPLAPAETGTLLEVLRPNGTPTTSLTL